MMDKQKLLEKMEEGKAEFETYTGVIYGVNFCKRLVEKYLDEHEITTEEAWEKIAERYDSDPGMTKSVYLNALNSFEGGCPRLVTEGHIRTWNPDVGKPEIPHCVASKLESLRNAGKSDSTIYWNFFGDEEMVEWANDNANILMEALVNGYTVKEPVWVVRINYSEEYFVGFSKGFHPDDKERPDFYSVLEHEQEIDFKIKKFTNKQKAEAVATLVDGTVEEWR